MKVIDVSKKIGLLQTFMNFFMWRKNIKNRLVLDEIIIDA
jgi:hypothetical protein